MGNNNILTLEKIPYLLTMLFALIGWTLTHIADRLLQSPIIEYRVEEQQDNNDRTVSLTLTNISKDKLFKDVQFDWLIQDINKGKFIRDSSYLTEFPPMTLQTTEETEEDHVRFTIKEFHPSWKLQLTSKVLGSALPTLHFSTMSNIQEKNPTVEPIFLIDASFETFLVKNELEILFYLLLLWFLLIMAYIILFFSKAKSFGNDQGKNSRHHAYNSTKTENSSRRENSNA